MQHFGFADTYTANALWLKEDDWLTKTVRHSLIFSPTKEGNWDILDTQRKHHVAIQDSLLPLSNRFLSVQHGLDFVIPEEHCEEGHGLGGRKFTTNTCTRTYETVA